MQLFEDITNADPEPLGEGYSPEIKDLTSKLFIKDPEKRFGSTGNGAKDIVNHPWFAEIDLPTAREKLLKAPYLPLEPADDEEGEWH